MNKKVIIAVLTLCIVIALISGCGKKSSDSPIPSFEFTPIELNTDSQINTFEKATEGKTSIGMDISGLWVYNTNAYLFMENGKAIFNSTVWDYTFDESVIHCTTEGLDPTDIKCLNTEDGLIIQCGLAVYTFEKVEIDKYEAALGLWVPENGISSQIGDPMRCLYFDERGYSKESLFIIGNEFDRESLELDGIYTVCVITKDTINNYYMENQCDIKTSTYCMDGDTLVIKDSTGESSRYVSYDSFLASVTN